LQVTLSAPSTQTVTVNYAVTGGTATGGGVDYTLASGQLSFSAGQTSKPIAIAIVNDSVPEPAETIIVTLSSPTNATLGSPSSHTYTILDNDLPTVQFSQASSAGPEATTPANLQVTLSSASTQTVTVNYAVTGGTATGGGVDYTLASGQLSFSAGQTSKPIAIAIVNDIVPEPAETIVVALSSPTNATLGSPVSHTYTIQDDDTKTIGNTTVFSLSVINGNRRALPFTMAEDGMIESVSMYHGSGTGNMILSVYGTGANGLPGPRLGVTASTAVNGVAGWQTIALTSPVTVQAGTTIWLGWVYQNAVSVYYQTGTPGRADSGVGWSGGMPDPFGSSTQANTVYSIYATYATVNKAGKTDAIDMQDIVNTVLGIP
jgi:hypothetical protein